MTHHVFYDTETTGPEPAYDQILQAAAIVTDDDFNEIDSIDIRSRLAGHIIPTPGALKVTHVDPYEIARAPYSAYEFARAVHEIFSRWSGSQETAFAGYNTIRFDEEIMRQMFWQSLQDPYLTSGKNKLRSDYLITMRALHARNPDVINFPVHPETGKKSFKLENLAPANGFDGHDAHDALGDVRATIFLARLIRDTDPHLFEHMLLMGNANTAREFVDSEVVFQLLGGPMLNPGVIDACLIGSEATNPKNKSAWNLAIDPTPYLDLSPEDILAQMKKSGTPFRTVKCNKQPGVFPMNWGFLNRVSTDDFVPADADTIDERADIIRNHEGFRKSVEEAMALKSASYDAKEHLEEKIYSGFPSWDDKDRMRRFHACPDWASRLEVVRDIQKDELRALGLRMVFLNAPETLSEALREKIDERLAEDRFTLDSDRPWTTIGTVMEELDEMDEKFPGDPEVANIRAWVLETYPVAHGWDTYKAEVAARAAAKAEAEAKAEDKPAAGAAQEETQEAADASEEEVEVTVVAPVVAPCATSMPAAKAKAPVTRIAETAMSFLDGLE